MAELLELASSNEENQLNVLVNKVLNNMCYEKFDCSKLHIENIKEILLTIYANFWGTKLSHRPFYIDTDIDNYDIESNIGYIDIDIKSIVINDIDSKFKNPFSIIDDITKNKVKFCFPTIEHTFIADRSIKEKYSVEGEKLALIRSRKQTKEKLLEKGLIEEAEKIQVTQEDVDKLNDFDDRKSKDYLRFLQCQLLIAVGNKELKTLEEKIEAYDTQVDATTWIRYAEVLSKEAKFGIDDNYKFILNDKPITRRFSFRYVEFIPSVEQRADTGYSIQFDD
jgi:hypothetical protein